jgi:hypothetical protein
MNTAELFCNDCKRKRPHSIVYTFVPSPEKFQSNGEYFLVSTSEFQILSCTACGDVSYRTQHVLPNFMEFDDERQIWTSNEKVIERIFPDRSNEVRQTKYLQGIPESLHRLYKEIIDSYNASMLLLCTAGLRSMTEAICNHFKIGGSTLEIRINTLEKNGFISYQTAQALHAHKFLGNDALLNQIPATKTELSIVLDLLENILHNLFSLPRLQSKLSEAISKRVGTSENL